MPNSTSVTTKIRLHRCYWNTQHLYKVMIITIEIFTWNLEWMFTTSEVLWTLRTQVLNLPNFNLNNIFNLSFHVSNPPTADFCEGTHRPLILLQGIVNKMWYLELVARVSSAFWMVQLKGTVCAFPFPKRSSLIECRNRDALVWFDISVHYLIIMFLSIHLIFLNEEKYLPSGLYNELFVRSATKYLAFFCQNLPHLIQGANPSHP